MDSTDTAGKESGGRVVVIVGRVVGEQVGVRTHFYNFSSRKEDLIFALLLYC